MVGGDFWNGGNHAFIHDDGITFRMAGDIMDYMKFNIYAPSLMGNRILSPLNRKSCLD